MFYPKQAAWLGVASLGICCAGSAFGSGIPSPQELSSAFNSVFKGKPFNSVELRYGQPNASFPYGQLTVYQFRVTNPVRLQEPTSSGWEGYNQTMSCMMRVGVNPDGTVDGVDFVGQMGACQVFIP